MMLGYICCTMQSAQSLSVLDHETQCSTKEVMALQNMFFMEKVAMYSSLYLPHTPHVRKEAQHLYVGRN